jgi:hypothetical protein
VAAAAWVLIASIPFAALGRMLAMAQIITAHPNLRRHASLARKWVLAKALGDRMGVGAQNRRVRHAVTMWSAIAAGAYLGRRSSWTDDDPRHDDRLSERMVAQLAGTFGEIMGQTPSGQI